MQHGSDNSSSTQTGPDIVRVQPRIALPKDTRQPSALENIKTYSAAPSLALANKARRLSEGFQAFTRSNSQPVISVNDVQEQPFESDDDWPDIDCQVATNGVSIASGCIYSAWDRLSDGRRLLLNVYPSHLQIWDYSNLDNIAELLSLRISADLGNLVSACVLAAPRRPESAIWKDGPALAVLSSTSSMRGQLNIYSLITRKHLKPIFIDGRPLSLRNNERFITISCLSSIHVLNNSDLEFCPFSPINDVAASKPVIALGSSRLFAYATSRPLRNIADSGIIGDQAWSTGHDAQSPISPVNTSDMARKVGEGVLSGAKALGSYGYAYWSGSQSTSAYSKSAPAASHLSRRSEPRSASEGSASNQGFVVVVDLAKIDPLSRKPTVLAHFRPSHNPISALSINPAGNLILTASSEGHSFHIFQLRPDPLSAPISTTTKHGLQSIERHVPKVLHQYKLYRGLTPAKIRKVDWAKDGRFVSVGTDGGTAHVFGLHPDGGFPEVEELLEPRTKNSRQLAASSVSLQPLFRIKAPAMPSGSPTAQTSLPTMLDFDLSDQQKKLLIFFPSTASMLLAHLKLVKQDPKPSLVVPVESISGIGRLLRQHGHSSHVESNAKIAVDRKCCWDLRADLSIKSLSTGFEVQTKDERPSIRSTAQAEVQTFNQHTTGKSIYLSPRFEFATFPCSFDGFAVGNFSPPDRPVVVRKEVEFNASSPPREHIKSAMGSTLDLSSASTSPSSPSWSQGSPAKHSSRWRDALPVRSFATSVPINLVNDSIRQVKNEIGRVAANYREAPSSVSFEKDTIAPEDDVPSLDYNSTTGSSNNQNSEDDVADAWELSPIISPVVRIQQTDDLVEPFVLDDAGQDFSLQPFDEPIPPIVAKKKFAESDVTKLPEPLITSKPDKPKEIKLEKPSTSKKNKSKSRS